VFRLAHRSTVSPHRARPLLRWGCVIASGAMLLWAVFGFLPGAHPYAHANGRDEIHVLVHPSSRVVSLSGLMLEAIYTRSTTRWDDGSTIVPFNLGSTDPVRHSFDRAVLQLSPELVGRFWLDQRIRGLGAPPKQVPDIALMVRVIERLAGSIGYAPASRTGSTAKVVARLVNGKVVSP
jgi:hypothetical protein